MRGDVYLVDLNPSRGSEQAGIRPAILVQTDNLDRFTQYLRQNEKCRSL